MLRKVLVANRGEIAVRILLTLREMGIRSVAVYSDPDRNAPHVRLADEALPLGGATSAETYRNAGKLLAAAREAGADAIHPGYGFLSESAAFAEAVERAGLVFVGPPARAIAAMGDKVEARRLVAAAGVPVVPGWSGASASIRAARKAAERLGFPLLVKAAAGGGGRGMRRVDRPEELEPALTTARSEAEESFGDGRLFLERYLPRARHVEFQVFGDRHGNLVHLFERDCSLQRRHQKIVEEAPAPGLDGDLRARMAEAALAAARAVDYCNAGTVEFLLDEDGRFYFLEMNTRLQVEHPVTEAIVGRDLVRAQLLVAAGEPLPFGQPEGPPRGHAIECRIYAEDPDRGFVPTAGTLRVFRPPAGPGLRVDSGVEEGWEVSVHYDPLLAKLIAFAESREAALARLEAALERFAVLGLPTNLPFLRALVRHPAFREGRVHTRFLEENPIRAEGAAPPPEALAAAALTLTAAPTPASRDGRPTRQPSPWLEAGPWRP